MSDKKNIKQQENDYRNYFFRINLKNNFNFQTYELKFYTKPLKFCAYLAQAVEKKTSLSSKLCFYCFCTFKPKYQSHDNNFKHTGNITNKSNNNSHSNELNSSRYIICILYALALAYLIPQMFEKKMITQYIEGKYYVFATVTQFGKSRLFRQIFHLWFYLICVYIIPFLLIFVFNLLLLRAFLSSKKRCQRYKLKLDPSIILKV